MLHSLIQQKDLLISFQMYTSKVIKLVQRNVAYRVSFDRACLFASGFQDSRQSAVIVPCIFGTKYTFLEPELSISLNAVSSLKIALRAKTEISRSTLNKIEILNRITGKMASSKLL